jgi:acetate CoA/acetoacetate CoA-transferase alpha subunit
MNKVTTIENAIHQIKRGDTVLIGGFCNVGCPLNLVYELAKYPEINELTTISEEFGYFGLPYKQGLEPLLDNGQLKKVVISFLASHRRLEQAYLNGEVELQFIPQGTLAERLHAGGTGLGGFYALTGVGTEVEEGKETKVIDGKKYILEKPLRGNVALVKAYKADSMGNAVFKLTANNFNTCMAMAADHVILEVEKLVETGEIEPDQVHLPGVFVDQIVVAEGVMF